ncbi:hypothetical protein OS175_02715 [Marinicella sp. S1101]|uniref:hypothetical protein n=1 Tax=Marinicella marina TaxID=2996016 RepID=UPI002260F9B2|nr:hypothetical protein [Marinicella marina]MCX7552779.1 hypothetical protein [Marinicella marina]MDJ1139912.1 hypothetical protein [Marinicella marina]
MKKLIFCLLFPLMCQAQWSDDAFNNLIISDRSGEQAQAKMVAAENGFSYISWFDNSDGGYDVYLQRLDANGNAQWAQNGILVASRNFSSTQDYGLAIDAAGHALLAFRNDRDGNESITGQKINSQGGLMWGVNGVDVSGNGGILANPKISGTTDGQAVIIWTEGPLVKAQRLDVDGTKLWSDGITVSDPSSTFISSDIQASDQGQVIVAMVESSGFSSPKHLFAQKLAALDGAGLWGLNPIPVFAPANGSLQFGNFPAFISDSMGGAIFTWYTSSPSLNTWVQRIDTNGNELFDTDGIETSTNQAQLRVSPTSSFDPLTKEIYTFWVELSNNQSQAGIYGQKFDAMGNRQWTNDGRVVAAITSSARSFVQNLLINDQPMVAWINSRSFNNDSIEASKVNTNGEVIWQTEIGSNTSTDSRLNSVANSQGFGMFTWTENSDLKAQNLNPNGSLGRDLIFADGFNQQ